MRAPWLAFAVWCLLASAMLLAEGCRPLHQDGATARTAKTQEERAAGEDAILLAAVRRALDNGASPDEVETSVGAEAAVHSSRDDLRRLWRSCRVLADPEHNPSIPDLRQARDFVLWERPVSYEFAVPPATRIVYPRVVGIAWTRDGGRRLFFGVLHWRP